MLPPRGPERGADRVVMVKQHRYAGVRKRRSAIPRSLAAHLLNGSRASAGTLRYYRFMPYLNPRQGAVEELMADMVLADLTVALRKSRECVRRESPTIIAK